MLEGRWKKTACIPEVSTAASANGYDTEHCRDDLILFYYDDGRHSVRADRCVRHSAAGSKIITGLLDFVVGNLTPFRGEVSHWGTKLPVFINGFKILEQTVVCWVSATGDEGRKDTEKQENVRWGTLSEQHPRRVKPALFSEAPPAPDSQSRRLAAWTPSAHACHVGIIPLFALSLTVP